MTKLSRMDKYKELRSQIEESQAVPEKSEPAPAPSSGTRLAAPDAKRASRSDVPVHPATPVIEGVLGEVKQYNLDNGDLVTDDTQMQILYDLSEDRDPAERRRKHLETMEANEAAGGTTLNIYASSLEAVSEANKAAAAKGEEKPESLHFSLESKALLADDAAEDDQLDLISFGKGDKKEQPEEDASPSKMRHDERKAARKKEREANDARAKAKARARAEKKAADEKRRQAEQLAAPQQTAAPAKPAAARPEPAKEVQEEPEEKKSTGANIVIGLFIVILIAAIGACVYLMKKLGIF